MCSLLRFQPTIAASPEHYIWRRCLPGTGAKGIQAVEGVISAVSRGRKRVAALRIPAVNVATVSDATFRALDVISLLSKNKTKGLQTLQQQMLNLQYQENKSPVVSKKFLYLASVWTGYDNQLSNQLSSISQYFILQPFPAATFPMRKLHIFKKNKTKQRKQTSNSYSTMLKKKRKKSKELRKKYHQVWIYKNTMTDENKNKN